MSELNETLWGAWCRTCKKMVFRGDVFKNIGWPYCPDCKVTTYDDPRWPGTLFEWVPPMNKKDGILGIWDEASL